MKMIKMISKIIIGLLITIFLLGLIFLNQFTNTVLNKEFVLKKIQENNYYDNLYADIINQLEGYIGPSGLEEEILTNIITREKVKNDVNLFIESIYEDKELKLNTEEIENKLNDNINQYIKKNGLKVTNEENIEEFKQQIIQEYEKEITYNTYVKHIKNISFKNLIKITKIARMLCFIIILILIIIYLLIEKNFYRKKFSEIVTFFLGCGIITNVVIIWINSKLNIENITILNEAISILFRDISIDILNRLEMKGKGLAGISFLIIILNNSLCFNQRNNKK